MFSLDDSVSMIPAKSFMVVPQALKQRGDRDQATGRLLLTGRLFIYLAT